MIQPCAVEDKSEEDSESQGYPLRYYFNNILFFFLIVSKKVPNKEGALPWR